MDLWGILRGATALMPPVTKVLIRYPTDAKLLCEYIEKVYPMMCEANREPNIHRMRTKYLDVSRDNMAYVKQHRHSKERTRKMIHRLLNLLGKILEELKILDRENPCVGLFSQKSNSKK